ncbi:helicase MOV-10-like [Anastrepha ludens]|uniref:helicase MOV-10-like n=1 Tax=Anastrepha ludens TaxID=28586 RepID=UPI0023B141BB|nr:helicase MOV-10-like [Anastrepha ludens]
MAKKSRGTSRTFEKEVVGQFLMYLLGCQKEKPTTDWSILKKETYAEFRKFLDLPRNDNLRKRMSHFNEIGTFLHRTGYLIDTPKGSEFFCINYQKMMLFKEIDEMHKNFEKKLMVDSKEKEKLHRLPANSFFKAIQCLPHYLPPLTLLELKKQKYADEKLCETSSQFADYFNGGRIFTPENMRGAMQLLLQIEDIEVLQKYRRLIQRDVKLSQSHGHPRKYSLKLARKSRKIGCSNEALLSRYNHVLVIRECPITKSILKDFFLPFLLSGSMELNLPGKAIGPTVIGQIDSIVERTVTFITEIELPDPNVSYLIIFCPARLTLRYQYAALELYGKKQAIMQRFLFPNHMKPLVLLEMRLRFYDKNIAANPEQKQAVHSIVSGSKFGLLFTPFVIFGPPGTGKTSVVVESILQLLLHEPNAKVLVTAGPNCACDEVALRICKMLSLNKEPRTEILARIYSYSQERRRENIDKLVIEYSNMYEWHFLPDVKELQKYRVVVCTLGAVGKFSTGDFQPFTHVFLDEAAACSMSESLVGIMNTLNEKSKLIISGDYKQLGAILNSKRAEKLGLHVTFMERLLQRKCYEVDEASGDYNRCIQTQLRRNFRSHPAIVKLFSQLYYDDELQAMSTADDTNLAAKWSRLKDPNFPILFHAVHGKEEVDDDTGSVSNTKEIDEVLNYVHILLEEGLGGERMLDESDIGIISPYRSQYLAIQEDLNALRKFRIETGSVETYRGKEKSVIIVSFVRSDSHGLGFLSNPKRLNVILSRAKSLLILVGNDEKLSEHKDYEFVIKECQRHGNFIPAPPKINKISSTK